MERIHILAPLGLGVLLTFVSLMDEVILTWKLERYLAPRNATERETIKNIAIGAVSLTSFMANSLIFIVNLLLALSLYNSPWVRLSVSFLVLLCLLALFYGAVALAIRKDIVDIAEHTIGGVFIKSWLWRAQIAFNIVAFVLIGIGLLLSNESGATNVDIVMSENNQPMPGLMAFDWTFSYIPPPQIIMQLAADPQDIMAFSIPALSLPCLNIIEERPGQLCLATCRQCQSTRSTHHPVPLPPSF